MPLQVIDLNGRITLIKSVKGDLQFLRAAFFLLQARCRFAPLLNNAPTCDKTTCALTSSQNAGNPCFHPSCRPMRNRMR